MNTRTTPRFARTTTRGSALGLESPLPPILAGVPEVRERAEDHARIAERLMKQRTTIVELSRELAKTEAEDERARVAAASKGRTLPTGKSEAVRARLDAAESEREAIEQALIESADELLAVARPYLGDARGRVAEEEERALARSEELIAALDSALERLQTLADEERWIDAAEAQSRLVDPFRSVGGDRSIGQLRGALRREFDEWKVKREQHEAEAERVAAFEREQDAERARHEEEVRREQEAQRVVVEDGRIVERGGVPVRQTGFGFQEVEEDERA